MMMFFNKIGWIYRVLATGFAYTVFGVGGVIASILVIPVLYLLPGGKIKRQQRAQYIVHWMFLTFVHFIRFIGLMRWRVEGIEKLQGSGRLLLANHPTLLDIVFLMAFIPNATCIVKSRLRSNLAMSGFIALTGYIANDHGPSLIDSALESLQAGSTLIIFPEGTRTSMHKPINLLRGAANIAVRCKINITPVIIDCEPPTLSKEHKWYNVPSCPFVMSFVFKDDITMAAFSNQPATIESRRLTSYLENYFLKETQLHV